MGNDERRGRKEGSVGIADFLDSFQIVTVTNCRESFLFLLHQSPFGPVRPLQDYGIQDMGVNVVLGHCPDEAKTPARR